MLKNKQQQRVRRASATRHKIKYNQATCLLVHRTPRHIYAQVVTPEGQVLAYSSTLDKTVRAEYKSYTGNVEAAKAVGKDVALKALKAGVKKVAFDRRGYKYHGRVKALADAAREQGLEF